MNSETHSHNHRLSRWLAQPYKGVLSAGLKAHRSILHLQATPYRHRCGYTEPEPSPAGEGGTVEIKEVIVEKEYRKLGIGKELIRRLEADARIAGYRFSVLTIEKVSEEVSELCKKSKYKVIPNYGKYADIPDAVCMGKKL